MLSLCRHGRVFTAADSGARGRGFESRWVAHSLIQDRSIERRCIVPGSPSIHELSEEAAHYQDGLEGTEGSASPATYAQHLVSTLNGHEKQDFLGGRECVFYQLLQIIHVIDICYFFDKLEIQVPP
jgi:hypothetical protein